MNEPLTNLDSCGIQSSRLLHSCTRCLRFRHAVKVEKLQRAIQTTWRMIKMMERKTLIDSGVTVDCVTMESCSISAVNKRLSSLHIINSSSPQACDHPRSLGIQSWHQCWDIEVPPTLRGRNASATLNEFMMSCLKLMYRNYRLYPTIFTYLHLSSNREHRNSSAALPIAVVGLS